MEPVSFKICAKHMMNPHHRSQMLLRWCQLEHCSWCHCNYRLYKVPPQSTLLFDWIQTRIVGEISFQNGYSKYNKMVYSVVNSWPPSLHFISKLIRNCVFNTKIINNIVCFRVLNQCLIQKKITASFIAETPTLSFL